MKGGLTTEVVSASPLERFGRVGALRPRTVAESSGRGPGEEPSRSPRWPTCVHHLSGDEGGTETLVACCVDGRRVDVARERGSCASAIFPFRVHTVGIEPKEMDGDGLVLRAYGFGESGEVDLRPAARRKSASGGWIATGADDGDVVSVSVDDLGSRAALAPAATRIEESSSPLREVREVFETLSSPVHVRLRCFKYPLAVPVFARRRRSCGLDLFVALFARESRPRGVTVGGTASGAVVVRGGPVDDMTPFSLVNIGEPVVFVDLIDFGGEDTEGLLAVGERGTVAVVRLEEGTGLPVVDEARLGAAHGASTITSCALCIDRGEGQGGGPPCLVYASEDGSCFACAVQRGATRLHPRPLTIADQVMMVEACDRTGVAFLFRANGEILRARPIDFLSRDSRGDPLGGEESPENLALRLEHVMDGQARLGKVVEKCVEEANKTLTLFLDHHHHRHLRGSVACPEDNVLEVSLIDTRDLKTSNIKRIVSWRWPTGLSQASRTKARSGICTHKTRTVQMNGTPRTFVCQQVGDRFFIYALLRLVPECLASEALSLGEGRLAGCEGAIGGKPAMVLVDMASADSLASKTETTGRDLRGVNGARWGGDGRSSKKRKVVFPLRVQDPRGGTGGDRKETVEGLHCEACALARQFGEVRECFIGGSEEEQETRYNKTMLQKRLGELWHKTRQLIVD